MGSTDWSSCSRLAATIVQNVTRHLLSGRHADAAAQHRYRIEHEALMPGELGALVEGRRIGNRAAAADEGAPVGFGLDLAAEATAASHEMGIADVGIVLVARCAGCA